MSHKLNSGIAVIGIDIGKNSFHVVGLCAHNAAVARTRNHGRVSTRGDEARRLALFMLFLGVESIGAGGQRRQALSPELHHPTIGGIFEAVDDKQQQREKIFAAMCEAAAIVQQRGIAIDEGDAIPRGLSGGPCRPGCPRLPSVARTVHSPGPKLIEKADAAARADASMRNSGAGLGLVGVWVYPRP